MKQLRFWFVGICAWFFLLYNMERLGDPLNLASFVYVFAFVSAVLLILVPALQRISFAWLLAGSLLPYFILKSQLGYPISGSELPIIITEICAIGITIFLAGQLGRRLEGVKETLASLIIGRLGQEAVPFATGQARIYSEIRRARLYERPATLLAISATEESVEFSIGYFIQEAQREIIKQYIAARISELLVEELHDCDIVARRNGHFITLMPETTRDTVGDIIRRIKEKAAEKLNLHLNVGLATFPDEAVTFESLLAIAEAQMATSNKDVTSHQLSGVAPEAKTVPSRRPKEASVQSIR